MNQPATRELIKSKHINLSSWCAANRFSYPMVQALIKSHGPILETKKQREVIAALIADGLYVPSEDEEKAA